MTILELNSYEKNHLLSKVLVLFRIRIQTLYCRITVNRQRCRHDFSIHERVVPPKNKKKPANGEWDAKSQQVKGNSPEAQLINTKLEQIRNQIKLYALNLAMQNKPYSADDLKSLYLGQTKLSYTVIETSEMMLEYMSKQPKDQVADGTLRGYKTRHNNMVKYMQHRKREHYTIPDFTPSVARDFMDYMRIDHVPPAKQSHAAKCLEYIKRVINHALDQEWIQFSPIQSFKIKKGESAQTPFLSRQELDRLEAKVFKLERLQRVKDIFVFLCHTGLSYQDARVFRASLDVVERDGIHFIDMTRFKTGIDFYVPITRTAWWILKRYGGEQLPIRSNTKTNAYLKEIQDLCEISTKLTVRVARATCGMVLLNEMNAPMETVSRILGHKNLRTTSKYYAKVLIKKVIHDVVNQNPESYEYEKL